MKTISIIVPVYNESANIPAIYDAITRVWCDSLPRYRYELIFVNDGSRDDTASRVCELTAKDPQVKFIDFSRNFGKELAMTAGLNAASGDAVMMIDADLQHPPHLIPQFVVAWEGGAEVVVGIRTKNTDEGIIKRWGSYWFHKLMHSIAEVDIVMGETDFRLLDRKVVAAFKMMPESGRMTRSLINWLGFRREYIAFVAPARLHGEASYSTVKLIRLAFYSIASNSLLPLRIAGYLGLLITITAGPLGLFVGINRYVFNDPLMLHVSGPAQLALVTLFLIGIVLMCLGFIALYIENIHRQVLRRPLYIVREQVNFASPYDLRPSPSVLQAPK